MIGDPRFRFVLCMSILKQKLITMLVRKGMPLYLGNAPLQFLFFGFDMFLLLLEPDLDFGLCAERLANLGQFTFKDIKSLALFLVLDFKFFSFTYIAGIRFNFFREVSLQCRLQSNKIRLFQPRLKENHWKHWSGTHDVVLRSFNVLVTFVSIILP
jgi:hypothetical protein